MTVEQFKKHKGKITKGSRRKKKFDIRGQCQDMSFLNDCARYGLPKPIQEYKFHPNRKWRMDFAWITFKLFIEKEGGIYEENGGGHRSIKGFLSNMEKYNAAAEMGWVLLRYLPQDIHSPETMQQIKNALIKRGMKIKQKGERNVEDVIRIR